MNSELIEWVSIVALSASVTAAAVLVQALQAKKYCCVAGFLAVAVLLNPAMPILRLPGGIILSLALLSMAPFAASLAFFRPRALLATPTR